MENWYDFIKFVHVLSFVFMSIPLFNLIVVSERGRMGPGIIYPVDRFVENIIAGGAPRCFVFQSTVLATGLLLLIFGPLGIEALWTSWVISLKTVLLFVLVVLLSRVHLGLQPKIEALISQIEEDKPVPDEIAAQIKPLRASRKKIASVCLFLVVTIIILGLQVYASFTPLLTLILIALAALFSRRAYSNGIPFGWV